jgi:hypothetical protein
VIPTPHELNEICDAISRDKGFFIEVGCFCCAQHGINRLYTMLFPIARPVTWAFAALPQVRHAAKSGQLRFHFGVLSKGEFQVPALSALALVHAFEAHGLEVEWSGLTRDTITVRVDKPSFEKIAEALEAEGEAHDTTDFPANYLEPPSFAEHIAPGDRFFSITLWKDPSGDRWWYNVSDVHPEGGTHEQRFEATRSEALTAALALAEQLRLEVN